MEKFYPSLYEGVGDKYAEREFNIPDDLSYEDKNESLIGEITDSWRGTPFKGVTKIYRNPKSLENFKSFVRALILENGDLYIADQSAYVIHIDIISLLIKKGILEGSLKPEDLQELMDADLNTKKILGVQRVGSRDMFGISEEIYLDLNNMKFLEEAQRKNPNFKFANKNVFALDRELKS